MHLSLDMCYFFFIDGLFLTSEVCGDELWLDLEEAVHIVRCEIYQKDHRADQGDRGAGHRVGCRHFINNL